jgi:hypothetical protein
MSAASTRHHQQSGDAGEVFAKARPSHHLGFSCEEKETKLERGASGEIHFPACGGASTFGRIALDLRVALCRQSCGIALTRDCPRCAYRYGEFVDETIVGSPRSSDCCKMWKSEQD